MSRGQGVQAREVLTGVENVSFFVNRSCLKLFKGVQRRVKLFVRTRS